MTNGKLIRKSRQLFKTHFQFFFFRESWLVKKHSSQNCPFSKLASRRGYNLCSLLLVHDFHNHSFIFKRENIVTVFHPEKCGLLGNFFLSLGKIGTQMLVPARPSALTSLLVIAHLKHNPSFLS